MADASYVSGLGKMGSKAVVYIGGEKNEKARLYTVSETLDTLGAGSFQNLMVVLISGFFLSTAAQALTASTLGAAMDKDWGYWLTLRDGLVLTSAIGSTCGMMLSGLLADAKGRRPAVLTAYIGMVLCTPMMAFCRNAEQMLMLRVLHGILTGIGVPAAWALLAETWPKALRQTGYCTLLFFSTVGTLFTGVLMLYIIPDLEDPAHWREVLLFTTLPALLFGVLSQLLLVESPHFLATKGRLGELEEVLHTVEKMNQGIRASRVRTIEVDVLEDAKVAPSCSGVTKAFCQTKGATASLVSLMGLVAVGSLLQMMTNGYWEPILYVQGGYLFQPAAQLVAARAWGVPASIITFLLVLENAMNYRTVMTFAAALTAITLVPVHFGAAEASSSAVLNAVATIATATFSGLALFAATDRFPTQVRCSCLGLVVAAGQLFTLLWPALFQVFGGDWGEEAPPFWIGLCVVVGLLGALGSYVCLKDTKGQELQDFLGAEDNGETTPLMEKRDNATS